MNKTSSSYPPHLPASPRNHAYRALRTLTRPDVFCDEALHDLLDREPLPQRDAALATALVQGVLRRRAALDAVLAKVPGFQYSRTAQPLRDVLRLALFQKHFLQRIPDHAIVNESVELARAISGERAASFTNAYLRKMLNAFSGGLPELRGRNERDTHSLRESMPAWIMKEIEGAFCPADKVSQEQSKSAATDRKKRSAAPPTSFRFQRSTFSDVECGTAAPGCEPLREILSRLNTQAALHLRPRDAKFKHANLSPGLFVPGALRLDGPLTSEIRQLLRDGALYVQDEAAQAVALLLGAQPGHVVVDFCAAPGGKTIIFHEQMRGEGHLFAYDPNRSRIMTLRGNVRRHQADSVVVIEEFSDLKSRIESLGGADRILLDAPCSGLGTLRRHPDLRWRKKSGDPKRLARLQLSLLAHALSLLKPGGRLLYSVCTFTRAETTDVVQKFLAAHSAQISLIPFSNLTELLPPIPRVAASPRPPVPASLTTPSGFFRPHPLHHDMDLFFAALFEKEV